MYGVGDSMISVGIEIGYSLANKFSKLAK